MEDMYAHQRANSEPHLSRNGAIIGTNACTHPPLLNHSF